MSYGTHAAVKAYIGGWNAHSGDAVRAAFTPDGVAIDPIYPHGVSGARVPVTLSGVDVCDLRDGKIAELRGYFDRGTIPDQVAAASRAAVASVAASAG